MRHRMGEREDGYEGKQSAKAVAMRPEREERVSERLAHRLPRVADTVVEEAAFNPRRDPNT